MQGARVLLCVDLSYQVYRATAAHPMLTCRRVFTGGLYGFMSSLAKTIRETKATDIVFCQDRKPYLRSNTYPEYKRIRKAKADDELLKMYQQSMKLVLEFFEDMGWSAWGLDGFESDDLIGHCVLKYRNRFKHIYAASNDSDLFQLLFAPNFSIYWQSITSVTTGDSLLKTAKLLPDQFMLMTAMTGTHNDIAGIAGVGPVTAKKAIADPQLMRSIRAKHADIIDRNLGLIKLPHPQFPTATTLPSTRYPLDRRTLYRALGKYDIDVTNAMLNSFEQIQP